MCKTKIKERKNKKETKEKEDDKNIIEVKEPPSFMEMIRAEKVHFL